MADNDEKPDFLNMSDDDFLKENIPASSTASEETQEPNATDEADKTNSEPDKVETTTQENADGGKPDTQADNEAGEKDDESGEDTPPVVEGKSDAKKPDADADKTADKDKGTSPADAKAQPEGKPDATKPDDQAQPKTEEEKPLTPEAFMAEVLKPFKANGKEITVKTPQEALRLMQMGAGYGRKLQELQPALKSLRMLEKHGLMDDAKLSYLIDLDQKNPEAIKKLIKESGIDPLELNTDDPVSYVPANRTVSDNEMAFTTSLRELESSPEGKATIQEINTTWDPTSKQVLFKSPELLSVIQIQRENGIYSQIAAEIDRQKMLGQMPHNKPFIEAYKIAGDYLVSTNSLKAPTATTPPAADVKPAPQDKVIVDTKVAKPASTVANDDKAKAAASTKTSSARRAVSGINPLAMSDEEFMKIGSMNLGSR